MSSRPRPILVDMPLHIKENIVSRVDFKTRYALEACSKHLHNIVNTTPTVYKDITLVRSAFYQGSGRFKEEWELIVTTQQSKFRLKAIRRWPDEKNHFRFVKALEGIFKNPRAHFDRIDIFCTDWVMLKKVLSSLNHKLSLRRVTLRENLHTKSILSVLPYLQPGVLEEINLSFSRRAGLKQLSQLDQWKQAKTFDLENPIIPIEQLFHLPELTLSIAQLTLEDAKKVIDFALKMGEEFRSWKIYSRTPIHSLKQHFGRFTKMDIPNSDLKMMLYFESDLFYLKNMKYCTECELGWKKYAEENREDSDFDDEELEDEEGGEEEEDQ